MSIPTHAVNLIARITNRVKGGFGTAITFTADPANIVTVNGVAIKHNTEFDASGKMVAGTLTASVTVSESVLRAQNYPVRNARNEINMKGNKVTFTDPSGLENTYVINKVRLGDTHGIIVCELGFYRNP
jgi:hypothetical protein